MAATGYEVETTKWKAVFLQPKRIIEEQLRKLLAACL